MEQTEEGRNEMPPETNEKAVAGTRQELPDAEVGSVFI